MIYMMMGFLWDTYRSHDRPTGLFEAWNTDGVVLQAGDFPRVPNLHGFPRDLVGEELVVFKKRAPGGWLFRAIFFGGG